MKLLFAKKNIMQIATLKHLSYFHSYIITNWVGNPIPLTAKMIENTKGTVSADNDHKHLFIQYIEVQIYTLRQYMMCLCLCVCVCVYLFGQDDRQQGWHSGERGGISSYH